jgi:membrane protease YdiL (CAAX protease family)
MFFGDSAADIASLGRLPMSYLVGQLIFWVFIMRTLLGGGLGEELGWRGFALPRLTEKHWAFRASLIIGLVWTFWHLPGHLISSNPLVNVVVQLLYTVPLSFVFTWLYYRTSESLLPVVLLHGALNGFNAFFEQTLFPSLAEEDGFVIFFILVVLIVGVVAAFRIRRLQVFFDAGKRMSGK